MEIFTFIVILIPTLILAKWTFGAAYYFHKDLQKITGVKIHPATSLLILKALQQKQNGDH